jgi:hypothetical protein
VEVKEKRRVEITVAMVAAMVGVAIVEMVAVAGEGATVAGTVAVEREARGHIHRLVQAAMVVVAAAAVAVVVMVMVAAMEVAVVMVVVMVVMVMVEEGTVAAELKVVMVRAVVMGVAEIVVAMPMAVVMVGVIWVGGRAMVATELGV